MSEKRIKQISFNAAFMQLDGFYLLLLSALYFSLWLYFYLTGHRLSLRVWQNLSQHLYTICWVVFITIPYLFARRWRILLLITVALHVLYLLASLWYYRTYYTLLPINAIEQAANLNGLLPSVTASVRVVDALLLLPLLVVVSCYRWRPNTPAPKGVKRNMVLMRSSILPLLLLYLYQAYTICNNKLPEVDQEVFHIDQFQAVHDFGLFSGFVWQLSEYSKASEPLTAVEQSEVHAWLRQYKMETCTTPPVDLPRKNLIVVLLESFESWPLESKIGNVEITPNLNRLLQTPNSIYAPHVVPQTKDGRSSDAQLILNTGLLPISSGAVSYQFPQHLYPSLAGALKQAGAYTCLTLVGDEPSFWNQGKMNPALNFDTLISSLNFDMTDEIGMGLSDKSFLEQSVQQLQQVQAPFYAQLITISTHSPFKIPEEKINVTLADTLPPLLKRYLEAVNYTDAAVGQFIRKLKAAGLYDNAVIVLLGDHEGIGRANRSELLAHESTPTQFSASPFVPLLILNAPETIRHEAVLGQIDIYPTLLDLLNLPAYSWRGLGKSMSDATRISVAVNQHGQLLGDTLQAQPDQVLHLKRAWEISDIMIRKNYFNTNPLPAAQQEALAE